MKKNQMKGPAEQAECQVKKPTEKAAPKKDLDDKGKGRKSVDKTQLGSRDFAESTKEVLRTSAEFFGGEK
jgi:hypothetical protein